MAGSRSFAASKFALELDGKAAGWVSSVAGGAAHADVISESFGQKHVGAVQYEDIVLTCGPGMSKAFYDWVGQASNTASGHLRRNGAILTCDYQNNVLGRLEWNTGLLTAISFPALDALSKDKGSIAIKITPESTRHFSGDKITVKSVPIAVAQKAWLCSSFRLKIDGLEEACKRVSRIGPISITSTTVKDYVGNARDYQVESGRVSLSDLIITLPESYAKNLYDWFQDFVIKGNSGADREKNGALEFMGPNMTTLFTLDFSHLGIYKMTEPKNLPGAEIRKVTANMYCEGITFTASKAMIG